MLYSRHAVYHAKPKAEDDILRSFMRTSSHAARNHRERVGAIVARSFEQTTDGIISLMESPQQGWRENHGKNRE